MKHGLLFITLSVTLALAAWRGFPGSAAGQAVLLLLALSYLLPGLAYVLGWPALFGKRPDGTVRPWVRALGFGYDTQMQASLWALRGLGYPHAAQVRPGLWLGRRLTSAEARALLAEQRIGGVLDATCELEEVAELRRLRYRNLGVLDAVAPSSAQLSEAAAWIEAHIEEGVYVHCAMGYGRGATLAAAYLLRAGHASSVEEAEALLRAARPGVCLRAPQRAALQRWWLTAAPAAGSRR